MRRFKKSEDLSRLNELIAMEVKIARIKAQMSQLQVSELTGLSRFKISRIELGKTDILMEDLIKICDVLETDPYELLKRADNELMKEKEEQEAKNEEQ